MTQAMAYELTKHQKFNRLKIKGDTQMFKIKVNTKKSTAKATLKKAKTELNKQIEQAKAERKQLKRDVKSYRLLKRQAKTTYKLTVNG